MLLIIIGKNFSIRPLVKAITPLKLYFLEMKYIIPLFILILSVSANTIEDTPTKIDDTTSNTRVTEPVSEPDSSALPTVPEVKVEETPTKTEETPTESSPKEPEVIQPIVVETAAEKTVEEKPEVKPVEETKKEIEEKPEVKPMEETKKENIADSIVKAVVDTAEKVAVAPAKLEKELVVVDKEPEKPTVEHTSIVDIFRATVDTSKEHGQFEEWSKCTASCGMHGIQFRLWNCDKEGPCVFT